MKKTLLKNFAMFTGELQAYNFIKNTLQHRCFPLNIAKFLRTSSTLSTSHWADASVLTLLSSSDNLLTGYEQLSY